MADGLHWEQRPPLRDPVLVAAFEGWNDAGDAASGAADWLVHHCDAPDPEPFATIDSDEHVDYQSRRPRVEITEGVATAIRWPEHACYATAWPERDVVVVRGIEPNLRWQSYCDGIIEVARETRCSTIVTLGALLGDVPHTRPTRVTGTSTDPALHEALSLVTSRYEGPTGIVGVLTDRCRADGLDAVSLWAPVPHYVANPPNPPATRALLQRLATVAALPLALDGLDQLSDLWRAQVDRALAENDEMLAYVRELEARFDADATGAAGGLDDRLDDGPGGLRPSADELVGEVERFLREQGNET
jgi:proteasome assembly chaperone (PAC2) family protein